MVLLGELGGVTDVGGVGELPSAGIAIVGAGDIDTPCANLVA